MAGKLRPFEPLLMTLHRIGDAILGAGFFLILSWVYGMYTSKYPGVSIIIFLATVVCFHTLGLYRSWRESSILIEFHHIFWACCLVYALLLITGYALKISHEFSRRVVLTWPGLMGLERLTIRRILRHYRKKGQNFRRAVIAGADNRGEQLAKGLLENPWIGIRVSGFFDDNNYNAVKEYDIFGNLDDLPSYVNQHHIDVVYITHSAGIRPKMNWLLRELADTTASVYLLPDLFFADLIMGGTVLYIADFPVISLRESPFRGVNALLKRFEDLILASFILTLASPIMAIVALAIKATSTGPILFKQWRYGIDGRPIKVYKFRTMNVCEDGYQFKQAIKCDPRLTKIGSFLRKTSLDELPQFINVIQGRMSIVGPRPHPVAMNEQYRKVVPGYMLRHKVKPGITGLAQINGWRGETDTLDKIENRVKHDLEYLQKWSLMLDLKIIAQTVFNGAWRTGAH
jgi:putative colanic acid biosynthesis UDP-glucose lipid carrier transferase